MDFDTILCPPHWFLNKKNKKNHSKSFCIHTFPINACISYVHADILRAHTHKQTNKTTKQANKQTHTQSKYLLVKKPLLCMHTHVRFIVLLLYNCTLNVLTK